MSLNRSICDSRCSGFPVELELPHIAIAPKLVHFSLPIAQRPSPDRTRGLIYAQLRCCEGSLLTTTTELQLSPRIVVSLRRTGNGSKEGSSSERLSLRRPHYLRQLWVDLRLAALRPALSRRYALIGESLLKKSLAVALAPAGACAKVPAIVRGKHDVKRRATRHPVTKSVSFRGN